MGSRILTRALGVTLQTMFQAIFFETIMRILEGINDKTIMGILLIIFLLNVMVSISINYINLFLIMTFGNLLMCNIIALLSYVSDPVLQIVIYYSIIVYLATLINQAIILLLWKAKASNDSEILGAKDYLY